MPLVINSLGSGHTRNHTHTHTDDPHKSNFKKPGTSRPVAGAPGLKIASKKSSKQDNYETYTWL